jgi:hypothetical protein
MNKLVLLLFGQLEHKEKRNLKIQIKNAYQKLQQSQGQHVALLCIRSLGHIVQKIFFSIQVEFSAIMRTKKCSHFTVFEGTLGWF